MKDDHKICFIICTNDEFYLQECIMYLQLLHVPEGYETDLITITDAASMAAGNNEGMAATDAKYKIYIHQDTFIIEYFFLDRLLKLFQTDKDIGMVGMVGAEYLSADGVMWHEKRCGNFYRLDEAIRRGMGSIELLAREDREVEVVDGFLIATQYDLPWREDIFKGWDFYDVSQCMEYRRAGYKIVVPGQEENWVIHACGAPSFLHYEENRELFLKEYPEVSARSRNRKQILLLKGREASWDNITSILVQLGHNVLAADCPAELKYGETAAQERVEEILEEGHYDLVINYEFNPYLNRLCHDYGASYYAWIRDKDILEG